MNLRFAAALSIGCALPVTAIVLWGLPNNSAAKSPPCAQKVIFAPQPDITPYELAQLQTKVASLALQICVAADDPIPAEMARHFRALP